MILDVLALDGEVWLNHVLVSILGEALRLRSSSQKCLCEILPLLLLYDNVAGLRLGLLVLLGAILGAFFFSGADVALLKVLTASFSLHDLRLLADADLAGMVFSDLRQVFVVVAASTVANH